MFGYLDVNKNNIEDGQRGLWQAFMCGLCFSTKKLFGNLPRMFITNDVNFFNVLFHSALETDVEVQNSRCFSHPIKKRTVAKPSELTDKLAVANVILTYLKLYDDVVDGGGVAKRTALRTFKKPYKKAQRLWAELDERLRASYEDLRKLERSDCASLDEVSHCFATLSQNFCKLVLAERTSEFAETLCYNLGKWIYLIDALDDAEKDLKRGNYNPFVAYYGVTNIQGLAARYDEISFLTYAVLNRIAQSFNDMNLYKYTCILKNVLFDSIREKNEQILLKLKQRENTK